MRRRNGFTLVELLVAIGIIALLISILIPALSAARARATRVACAARLRQLAAGVHMYANEHNGRVPGGHRDNNTEEHSIWISQGTYDALVKYAGSDKILACPNLEETQPNKPPENIGWVLGYAYLGGRIKTMNAHGWTSPLKISEKASLAIFCDFNDWSPGDGWTAIGHTRDGGGGFFLDTGGLSPAKRASAGGNVAYLDGSVDWRALGEMQERQTYSGGTGYLGAW